MRTTFIHIQKATVVVQILTLLLPLVVANTEIVNFGLDTGADDAPVVLLPEFVSWWPTLRFESNQGLWNMTPAPVGTPMHSVRGPPFSEQTGSGGGVSSETTSDSPFSGGEYHQELWLALDLSAEAWKGYTKFTLRLSWPASSPADFDIRIYDGRSLRIALGDRVEPTHEQNVKVSSARVRYARVRAVSTGVFTPKSPSSTSSKQRTSVPFALILEPLYFGVLPISLTSTLLLMVPVVVSAIILVPKIIAHFDSIVSGVRREHSAKRQ
ncbi:hypothetical protein PC9H_002964 [Pleurotus ostreatus]|uniref:Uncharacterized protein n=1 Tax=Pleurotus ostreatus TaxID=5322 RepID=A0A8H6ZXH3_PLEOS|nr:uncharacterized protein PC9H_002964 [Pleurotus ostreatus]KAF7436138.1 hypothetical protein PC9H_002964 [Pleurotus ostreatus]KAJ8701775.1 hypothetical protein PTI98_000528 [Pleurotus ostreatus]